MAPTLKPCQSSRNKGAKGIRTPSLVRTPVAPGYSTSNVPSLPSLNDLKVSAALKFGKIAPILSTANKSLGSRPPYPGGRLAGRPLLIVAVAAFAVVLPFFFLGIPSGHDFEFHLNSWIEVLSQWREGIVYPRWAALAHFGFGEARFIFYPPLSWTTGAALGLLLPWKLVPGAYIFLVLAFSGGSMFLLARRWLSRTDSIFAAAFYAANPYFIVIVYWRSAYAELLAGTLLPLLLLYLLELPERGSRAMVPLACVITAAVLTNAPTSVMVNYSVALLALTLAILFRSPKILLYAAIAGLIAAALSAFYILPAMYEEKWVNIAEVLSPGVRPQDNFLFTTIPDADHNRFNCLVSTIAAAEVVLLAVAVFLSRKRWRVKLPLWSVLVVWAAVCTFLMASVSGVLWTHLPLLRFLQLPWRLLLCFNVGFVLFVAMTRWPWRFVFGGVMVLALMLVGWHFQPPWWDHATDIANIASQQRSGTGYEGTDEYVPVDADPYDINRAEPRVACVGGIPVQVILSRWTTAERRFVADTAQPCTLILRLFNYPAWRVNLNGREVTTLTQEDTGEMLIPIAAGKNYVRVTFTPTRDRTLGGIISLFAAAGLLMWSLRSRIFPRRS